MFAAVDLGSNSFRMHIGTYDGSTIRIVKTARDPIRLGAGLDSKGNLTPQAMQAALASLSGFNAILKTYQLDAVRVVATNTMRIAKNATTNARRKKRDPFTSSTPPSSLSHRRAVKRIIECDHSNDFSM